MSEKNMKTKIAEFSIEQIFKVSHDRYCVPLYQREYAWGKKEIGRLLNDLYLAFKKGGNYYLGSFVVRQNVDDSAQFELVDGQQRLITLSILFALYLNADNVGKVLRFRARDDADGFIDACYDRTVLTSVVEGSGSDAFQTAVGEIRNFYPETMDDKREIVKGKGCPIDAVLAMVENGVTFRDYLMKKVILFRIELPESTDVNSYFEIMNNRGEQLQYHEIMKAKLLAKLQDRSANDPSLGTYDDLAVKFDDIWTACSRMNGYLGQHLHFCSRYLECPENGWTDPGRWSNFQKPLLNEVDKTGEADEHSVIWDFSNFLMHVLKCYQRKYVQDSTVVVTLDERDMQSKYEALEKDIDPVAFLDLLIRLRLKFDKFVVKSENDANGDVVAWRLGYVEKYQKSYETKNTFEGDIQARLIAFESMLQVSFNTQRNKDWLQYLLELGEDVFADKTGEKLLVSLKSWARAKLLNFKSEKERAGRNFYCLGLDSSRFLLNFVDYLMWENSQSKSLPEEFAVPGEFVFKYLNSVEHHHPQHDDQTYETWTLGQIDDIGNLFLVYSAENSSMSNREPQEKKNRYLASHGGLLPDSPKRHWMYEHTTQSGWARADMQKLSRYVQGLVNAFLARNGDENGTGWSL